MLQKQQEEEKRRRLLVAVAARQLLGEQGIEQGSFSSCHTHTDSSPPRVHSAGKQQEQQVISLISVSIFCDSKASARFQLCLNQ